MSILIHLSNIKYHEQMNDVPKENVPIPQVVVVRQVPTLEAESVRASAEDTTNKAIGSLRYILKSSEVSLLTFRARRYSVSIHISLQIRRQRH